MVKKIKSWILYLSLLSLFGLPAVGFTSLIKKENHIYSVAIMAIFQNDAEYLREWIEFHRLVGVKHFLLFNHLSTDNYHEVLQPYISKGIVELIDWTYPYNGIKEWNGIQSNAYMHGIALLKGKAKWVAIIDTDEFLFPVKENSLEKVLSGYKAAGVGVNWQVFGTSRVAKIGPNQLLIEALYLRCDANASVNLHVKSIVRPEYVIGCNNPHCVKYKKGQQQVNPDNVVFKGAFAPYVAVDKIRINHYSYRDEYYFHNVKIPRLIKWRGRGLENPEKFMEPLNEFPDNTINRFITPLKRNMGLKA